MASTTLKAGDKVYFGRTHGEKTLGEVVKVNRVKLKVRQLESRGVLRAYAVGTVWTVPVSLCTPAGDASSACPRCPGPGMGICAGCGIGTPASKRDEAEIMQEIRQLYSKLSPENLHCDGLISRSAAARRGAQFNRELRACFQELGRSVSEDEAFRGF